MKSAKLLFRITLVMMVLGSMTCVARHAYIIFNYAPIIWDGSPSDRAIDKYGRDKFVQQSLEYLTSGTMNSELYKEFKPKSIEVYYKGVLLIFAENKRYESGLYVDPKEFFEETGGSGGWVSYRSKHIGHAEFKKKGCV